MASIVESRALCELVMRDLIKARYSDVCMVLISGSVSFKM